MRRLIIANTYSQLMIALQMKNTMFKSDEIVVLISDYPNGAYEVEKRVESLGGFEETHFVAVQGRCTGRSVSTRIKDFVDIAFGRDGNYSFYTKDIKDLWFDELICYNYMIDMVALYSKLSDINPSLIVSLYEEGILSYGVCVENTVGRRIIDFIRKLRGKEIVHNHMGNFYCFYPSIYRGELKTVKIQSISSNTKTANELKEIFEIHENQMQYPEKYIFFTSVYDFEGGKPVGEYQLVERIAKVVGKDNLLVKQHPRDSRKIYKENGFHVDKNSSIPWEAIQLSYDFSDKVFLTVNSVSVLAASLMASTQVPTYYMYRLCDTSGNESCKNNIIDLENLLRDKNMKEILKSVRIADDERDIL